MLIIKKQKSLEYDAVKQRKKDSEIQKNIIAQNKKIIIDLNQQKVQERKEFLTFHKQR